MSTLRRRAFVFSCATRLRVSLLLLTVFTSYVAAGDEPSAEELVSGLISPNKPVNPKREPFVDFPRSYDHTAQKTVEQASDELLKLGFAAIPVLVQHLEDREYCRTRSFSIHVDLTVGDECYRLIDRITNPKVTPDFKALPKSQFKSIKGNPMTLGLDGEWDHVGLSYFDLLIHRDKAMSRKSIETWWKPFSNKSLDHIHLAAVQRLIAHEKSIGFGDDSIKERYLKPYYDLEKQLKARIDED